MEAFVEPGTIIKQVVSQLDLDNTLGGFDGAETVTLLNNTVNMTEQPLEVKISKPENEQNIGMDPNAKVEKQ